MLGLLALTEPAAESGSLADYCGQNADFCASMGAADAPVTLVEISDFGCSHCRNFHLQTAPLLAQTYVDTGQVRWIALPYALRTETLPAANAALCAGEQDAYFSFSEALFEQFGEPDNLTASGFMGAAEEVGLDTAAFGQCVDEGRYSSVVQDNVAAAGRAGVAATPTFFINGQKLEGAYPFSVFQQRIEALINSP